MKKQLLTLLIICCGISAMAQGNYFSFQYSIGVGTGDLGTFNSAASFRGATIEWRQLVQPSVAVGIEAGWNVFYKEIPFDTYTSGTASLSGKQFRTQNQVPLLLAVNYIWKPEEVVRPFVGLGIGTMYSRRNTDMNQYTIQQDAWHLAFRPEVGIQYELSNTTSGYIGLKYYMGMQSGELDKAQSYLAINLGFVFRE
jgi:hypothetical protein